MSSINRHNYEEFFILYIDNELGSVEKKMVEDFAAQHPDLKEELDLLMASKLIPDQTIFFEGKESLLKKETAGSLISENNIQDYLLLHLDNELNAEEKAATEKYTAANPAAAKEWELLLKTRLEPETITCPDKESLYKQEVKTGAVLIRFKWWRAAAAAVVLLVGGYFAYTVLSGKPETNNGMAKGSKPGQSGPEIAQPKNTPAPNPEQSGSKQEKTIQIQDAANAIAASPVTDQKEKKTQSSNTVNNYTALPAANDPGQNNIAEANNATVNNNLQRLDTKVDAVAVKTTTNPSLENIKNSGVTTKDYSPYNNTIADINNPEVDDVTGDDDARPERKNKLRGFFRKTTRMFERTTNISATDGDDRLLIGGLAVRLK